MHVSRSIRQDPNPLVRPDRGHEAPAARRRPQAERTAERPEPAVRSTREAPSAREGDSRLERLHDALERRLDRLRDARPTPEEPAEPSRRAPIARTITPTITPVRVRSAAPEVDGAPNVAAAPEGTAVTGAEGAPREVEPQDGAPHGAGNVLKGLLRIAKAMFQDARKELAANGEEGDLRDLGQLGHELRHALRDVRQRFRAGELDRAGALEELRGAFQSFAGGLEDLLGPGEEGGDVAPQPNTAPSAPVEPGPTATVTPDAAVEAPPAAVEPMDPAPVAPEAPAPVPSVAPVLTRPVDDAPAPKRHAGLLRRLSALREDLGALRERTLEMRTPESIATNRPERPERPEHPEHSARNAAGDARNTRRLAAVAELRDARNAVARFDVRA
jgi:hypothetical protein